MGARRARYNAPMSERFKELISGWDGVGVVMSYDQPTGAWMFICLHDNTLGPCTGGTRMKVYPTPEDGLEDAMRLGEGMTHKWAAVDGSFGGGKAVLAVPRIPTGDERTGLLRRYGRLVDSLRGGFKTGEDMGTTSEDFVVIAEETDNVQGFHPVKGHKVDPSPFTARGVYSGLRAALGSRFGTDDPAGRTVLIQGVGSVGLGLGRLLREAGAKVLVSDVDEDRVSAAARELEAEVVPPADVYRTTCDVYAPCAIGATLNETTIGELGCRIVAGSANNQLATDDDAGRLHERNILYVPDYIINAGGAVSFALLGQNVVDRDEILREMDAIGDTVREILAEAGERGETPVAAALRRVERNLGRSS